VSKLTPHGKEALQAQLSRARETLDGLVRDLRGVGGELEALSTEREHYRLLLQVCSGLEALRELGAAELFWGDRAGPDEDAAHLLLVRSRVDAFETRLGEIEERRQALLEEIENAQANSELIEDDLVEAKKRAEERKLEWVIERQVDAFPFRDSLMPWARGGEDDQRFRKALAAALLLGLLLGFLIPMIDLPLPEPWEPIEVPERFTRLIRAEPIQLPPSPTARETLAQEEKPEATEEPVAEKKPKKATSSKGILAFREEFSSLAESRPSARLGSQARIRGSDETASGRQQRALIATQAPGASGGIDVGALSRNVRGGGNGKIERVEVARATSSIGSGTGSDRPLSEGPGASRSDEEIQIVFDRHKAALYRLYNRALRKNPTLKGQMVLRITIRPDGSVTLCELHTSDMKAPQLGAQVVGRVKTFNFGAKDDIPAITILYPIDFLPAA
jgi:outer membrane biosynthesis protein TonB